MCDKKKRKAAKQRILQFLKDHGIRGLVDDIRGGEDKPFGALTDVAKGHCWLAVYCGAMTGKGKGKGTFLQLYSSDPTCLNDLRYSRYCMVHSADTARIKFLQEDPFNPHTKTRDMGRIPHPDMSWEKLSDEDLQVLLDDCKLLLNSANEVLGVFQGCV